MPISTVTSGRDIIEAVIETQHAAHQHRQGEAEQRTARGDQQVRPGGAFLEELLQTGEGLQRRRQYQRAVVDGYRFPGAEQQEQAGQRAPAAPQVARQTAQPAA